MVCGTTEGAADSKISNRPVTFEWNRIGIVRFEQLRRSLLFTSMPLWLFVCQVAIRHPVEVRQPVHHWSTVRQGRVPTELPAIHEGPPSTTAAAVDTHTVRVAVGLAVVGVDRATVAASQKQRGFGRF